MSRTKTTGELITRIRDLGEIRATYVTNATIVNEIDQSRLELLGKLVDVGACDYFEEAQDINLVADTSSYNLATDYFSTLGVDILLEDGDYYTIQRYNMADRNLEDDSESYRREEYRYRIRGDQIVLAPTPDYSQTNGIRVYYVAVPSALNTQLTNETIDGFWGWEDYIVYDCLVKFIGGKEEGDASVWQQLLAKTDARIDALKGRRDSAGPDTIVNVDFKSSTYPKLGKSV
jgi:hypothetical protein